jgi:hypothetical protein
VIGDHRARHAGRETGRGRVGALAAGGNVGLAGIEDGLILRGQRGLLRGGGLAGVSARRPDPHPLALQVGIFAEIEYVP